VEAISGKMGGRRRFTGKEAHLEKNPQDKIFKQLVEVPWSLGGRSRKSKKVAESGTTTS
jgi:hypothetical protein